MSCCCLEFLNVAPARVTFKGEQRKVEELTSGNFTSQELESGGLNAKQLRRAGPASLKAIGFTALQLKEAGFQATALKNCGFSLSDLKANGFDMKALYNAGFDIKPLKVAGFTGHDAYKANMALDTIASAYNLKEVIEGGYGPMKIHRIMQVGPREMMANGMPPHRIDEAERMFPSEAVWAETGPAGVQEKFCMK